MISEFAKQAREGKIDLVKHIKEVLAKAEKIDEEYNYLNYLAKDEAIAQAEELSKNPRGKLCGVAVTIKDAICAKDMHIRAGSRILEGYRPVFDSTIVQKIKDEGGIIIGTTAQDEFGFGGFSVNVGKGFKIPKNPYDKERSCGGSSGGAAGFAKKADFPHIAIGESTGGSIVSPGSFCGIYALCPTYGRVSRYGLLDYANSLDKIGPMAQDAEDVAIMMEIISGHDELDSTSLDVDKEDYLSYIEKDVSGMKIGVIKECFSDDVDKEVKEICMKQIDVLKSKGAIVEEVSMPITIKYGIPTYYMLSTSEASTNLAKYCGMRYGKTEKLEGNFNEYFTKVRSEHLGDEAKRRIILGTFARMSGFRDAYYMKAAKVRTRIINEYKTLFEKYDVLVSPAVPYASPKFDKIKEMKPLQHYLADIMLVGPNLAGMPHMNYPSGNNSEGMPVGLMGIADHLKEGKLIQLAGGLR